ncbi:hypothetical protein D9613_009933 [Agrocybe pediades]|uniref:Uncharacterized protein n=1 Tax=Agrocybe pediades TaxID=84607 RepID=A0A8H4VQ09_9AGAR|nr:hypothetical protein D9613_009933 [Agrocybe pediades]
MSTMANMTMELPNPQTPMAFFPPDLAWQITIALYSLVGASSVIIWDILTNLHTDIRMLKHSKANLSLAVYFVSRFSTLFYLLGETILQSQVTIHPCLNDELTPFDTLAAPLSHCENIHHLQALYPIAIPSTALLFFFRVRAMYEGNRLVVGFFSFMWFAVLAGSITPTIGVNATRIGSTNYCVNLGLAPYVSAACIVPFINDTLTFLATSWKLWQNAHVPQSIHNNVQVMVFGHHLPSFSKALLKDGQAYYLTTISLNLVTIALFFCNTSAVYKAFFGVPNVVLMNSMACHVYRNVRLGVYIGSTGTTTMSKNDRTSTILIGQGWNVNTNVARGNHVVNFDVELGDVSNGTIHGEDLHELGKTSNVRPV